ncbi:hypothetical protein SUGI_0551700 [Cryptomeria japonica]|nr:hypothetical protein SUGI_0551700 [Cryptomeria japonica]
MPCLSRCLACQQPWRIVTLESMCESAILSSAHLVTLLPLPSAKQGDSRLDTLGRAASESEFSTTSISSDDLEQTEIS